MKGSRWLTQFAALPIYLETSPAPQNVILHPERYDFSTLQTLLSDRSVLHSVAVWRYSLPGVQTPHLAPLSMCEQNIHTFVVRHMFVGDSFVMMSLDVVSVVLVALHRCQSLVVAHVQSFRLPVVCFVGYVRTVLYH